VPLEWHFEMTAYGGATLRITEGTISMFDGECAAGFHMQYAVRWFDFYRSR
jgi:hypothetical protein